MPLKATDPKAPVTQAQLTAIFKAILDVARLQALIQAPKGSPSNASLSKRPRPSVSLNPHQGEESSQRQSIMHTEPNQVQGRRS